MRSVTRDLTNANAMTAPFAASPITVGQFLTPSGAGFYIPLYQRSYQWKPGNVSRLVDDIVHGITRFENERSSTFIGTIITVDNHSDLFPPATVRLSRVIQIIDGQQRIATLLCMCGELRRAIHSAYQRLSENDHAIFGPRVHDHITALEKPLFVTISDASDSSLPRMIRGGVDCWTQGHSGYTSEIGKYLRAYDLQHDRSQTTGNSLFDRAIVRLHRTFGADHLFDGAIERLDEDRRRTLLGFDNSANIDRNRFKRLQELLVFSTFLQNYVHAISVEADDPNSAYTVFESLNTTGEPLTAFETFVPLVVSTVGGQSGYVDSWEKEQIDQCNSVFHGWRPKQVTNRTTEVLVAFALSDTGKKVGNQLYAQRRHLRTYLSLSPEHQKVFLEGLSSTATWLNHLWYEDNPLPMSSEGTRVALRMLIDSGHTIPRALLIRGYEEFMERDPCLFYRLVRVVANFWLLWRLSRSNTNSIDNHHRNLMAGMEIQNQNTIGPYCRQPLRYAGKSPHPDEVAINLRWILRYKGGITDRDTWVNKVTNLSHGSGTGRHKKLLRYALLGAYHDAVPDQTDFVRRGTRRSSDTLTSAWYSAELTLEHIAPRNREVNDDSYHDDVYLERRVHRLGNLTLLPQEENQHLDNLSWGKKKNYFSVFSERDLTSRTEMIAQSDLHGSTIHLLERDFIPFCADLAQCEAEQWTALDVARRGRSLAYMIWDQFAPSLGL